MPILNRTALTPAAQIVCIKKIGIIYFDRNAKNLLCFLPLHKPPIRLISAKHATKPSSKSSAAKFILYTVFSIAAAIFVEFFVNSEIGQLHSEHKPD